MENDENRPRFCEECHTSVMNAGRTYQGRDGVIRYFCPRPKTCLQDYWHRTGLHLPGEVVAQSTYKDLEYIVTYTGGVGQFGVGRGIFDWHLEVWRTEGTQRENVLDTFLTGESPPSAEQLAQHLEHLMVRGKL